MYRAVIWSLQTPSPISQPLSPRPPIYREISPWLHPLCCSKYIWTCYQPYYAKCCVPQIFISIYSTFCIFFQTSYLPNAIIPGKWFVCSISSYNYLSFILLCLSLTTRHHLALLYVMFTTLHKTSNPPHSDKKMAARYMSRRTTSIVTDFLLWSHSSHLKC